MAHKPRKRFGQNFLQDPTYQQRIASSIRLKDDAKCLEIGPGKGAITAHLLKRFEHLDVIEMDRDLVELLQRKFPGPAVIRSTTSFCNINTISSITSRDSIS